MGGKEKREKPGWGREGCYERVAGRTLQVDEQSGKS